MRYSLQDLGGGSSSQENPRINQQDRQNITFSGSAYLKEISQQCTSATCTEAVHCQRVLLGSSIPVSDHKRLLDPPFGEGRQASRQLSDPITPKQMIETTQQTKKISHRQKSLLHGISSLFSTVNWHC